MKLAVIQNGNHQFLVSEGETVKMEKLSQTEGAKVTFDQVLLAATDKTTKVGQPHVKGAKVEGEILQQARHPKITGVKMKAKKRNRHFYGHKQPYTAVKITKITTR